MRAPSDRHDEIRFQESRRDVEKVAGGGAPRNPRASGPPYDRAPEVRQKRWYDMRRRSPKKALIVFHQPALEELEVFFLKRMPPMMLFLVEHVMPGGFKARGVNGERAISILPGERGTFQFVLGPARGIRFEFTHNIGEPVAWLQAGQDMHMIGHASDRMGVTIHVSDDSPQVGMESWEKLAREPCLAVLGGEDEVVVEGGVG